MKELDPARPGRDRAWSTSCSRWLLLAARLYVLFGLLQVGHGQDRRLGQHAGAVSRRVQGAGAAADLAAYVGTFGELFFPVLIALGLAGRFGAAGLFVVNVMAVVSYPQLFGFECPAGIHFHFFWGSIAGRTRRLRAGVGFRSMPGCCAGSASTAAKFAARRYDLGSRDHECSVPTFVLSRLWLTFIVLGVSFFVFGAAHRQPGPPVPRQRRLLQRLRLAGRDGRRAVAIDAARLTGYLSMAAYVVFKTCEHRLSDWLGAQHL